MGAVCCRSGADDDDDDERVGSAGGADGTEGVRVEVDLEQRRRALPAGFVGNCPDPESSPPPPRFGGKPRKMGVPPAANASHASPQSPKEGAHEQVGRKRRRRNSERDANGVQSASSKEAEVAAIRIQAATRGHLTRLEVARLRAGGGDILNDAGSSSPVTREIHDTVGVVCKSMSMMQVWWTAMRRGQRPSAPEGLAESLARLDENGDGLLHMIHLRDSLTLLGDDPLDDESADSLVAAIYETHEKDNAQSRDSLPVSAIVKFMSQDSIFVTLEGESLKDAASLCGCSAKRLGELSGFSRAQLSSEGLKDPLPAGILLTLPSK
jgi:hypothetical protein